MQFNLGRVTATQNAVDFCKKNDIYLFDIILRHARCDWGDMDAEDKVANDTAVQRGDGRIFSAYKYPAGRLWCITEADRSSTCVLLPSDY